MNLIWSNDYMNIAWHNKDFELDFIPDEEDLDIDLDKMKIPKIGKEGEKGKEDQNENEEDEADDKRTKLTEDNAPEEEKA